MNSGEWNEVVYVRLPAVPTKMSMTLSDKTLDTIFSEWGDLPWTEESVRAVLSMALVVEIDYEAGYIAAPAGCPAQREDVRFIIDRALGIPNENDAGNALCQTEGH